MIGVLAGLLAIGTGLAVAAVVEPTPRPPVGAYRLSLALLVLAAEVAAAGFKASTGDRIMVIAIVGVTALTAYGIGGRWRLGERPWPIEPKGP